MNPIAASRLLWRDGRGCAIHDGVRVELHGCPFPPPMAECDLALDSDDMVVTLLSIARDGTDGWRDMTNAETAAAIALLERIAHAARAMLGATT